MHIITQRDIDKHQTWYEIVLFHSNSYSIEHPEDGAKLLTELGCLRWSAPVALPALDPLQRLRPRRVENSEVVGLGAVFACRSAMKMSPQAASSCIKLHRSWSNPLIRNRNRRKNCKAKVSSAGSEGALLCWWATGLRAFWVQ